MKLPMLLTALLAFLPADPFNASDWPRFRGADGTGSLADRAYPEEWDGEDNVAWTVDVPGAGWSSPVVVGGRIYVTTAVQPGGKGPAGFQEGVSDPMTRGQSGEKPTEEVAFQLLCLGLDGGDTLWTREVGKLVPEYKVHPSNTYATSTPASDGERLFVTYGALGQVICFDLEGEEKWRVDIGVHKTGSDFGWGISLVADGGLVFVQNDNEEASFLAALDAATGSERWRVERGKGTSWGTPILLAGERPQLVACGADTVVSYAPDSGEELWRLTGMGSSFSSSPTSDGSHVFFGTSGPMSRGPLVAVPADAEGTIDIKDKEPAVAWVTDRAGPGFPSPVEHDGMLYVLGSPTQVACYDTASGERLWRERLPDAATLVASPWVAGGELNVLDEEGRTFVMKAGREFELLRTNYLDGLFWSTPSVAGEALLVRSASRLHCIRAE
ncbi:MAG: PQQ-binding-like beta-propeller repeat protein [Planctomycetota bacterium]